MSFVPSPFGIAPLTRRQMEAKARNEALQTKVCCDCGYEKPVTDFYFINVATCRRASYCKVCHDIRQKRTVAKRTYRRVVDDKQHGRADHRIEQVLARVAIGQSVEHACFRVGIEPDQVRDHLHRPAGIR